jgi:hypothetical protein
MNVLSPAEDVENFALFGTVPTHADTPDMASLQLKEAVCELPSE